MSRFKDPGAMAFMAGSNLFRPAEGKGRQRASAEASKWDTSVLMFSTPGTKDYSGLAGNTGVSIGDHEIDGTPVLFFQRAPILRLFRPDILSPDGLWGGAGRFPSRKTTLTYDFYYSRNDYTGGRRSAMECLGKIGSISI